ncbi:MAG: NAD(P)-dependent oxidoreductase [Marinilabiliales bacterium]|nr:MAG: NAD(P)-dependent oxidoreductase [Marinilabiliales bacterium]
MNKIILITGATAGIGEATARLLASEGNHLIITGRRKEKLNQLSKDLINQFGVRVTYLTFDIRKKEEVNKAINSLEKDWKNIDVLINNAGLAVGLSPLHDGLTEDWDTMIDTNLKGLLYITRKVSPLMIKQKHGHIVNIGSIAGKEVYPGGNVYCSTKHGVEALTKAMRMELVEHGIKVTSVCPGMVETEFSEVRFKGDKTKAKAVYEGFEPLHAEDIAETIHFIITRPDHVNINDILIMPTAQANAGLTIKNK